MPVCDTLLVAVNAKYSHTNLAVRSLCLALKQAGIAADFAEYTINQPVSAILADIVEKQPKRLLFSCYIWNIHYIRRLGSDFRALFAQARILLGGPEVSFEPEQMLREMPWADAILCGEGERIICEALSSADFGSHWSVYKAQDHINLDDLPFLYPDLDLLQNRVIYYESSRGCPLGCAYCLSSVDRKVRWRSLPLVFSDLQRFLDAQVMQVKFVDRTFNLDADRAYQIWEYLIAHDNEITSFQMEIGGDLLTARQIALLGKARQGLFQFEIGVQSTHEQTLGEVVRITDLKKLADNVGAVSALGNIHQHLDLIAGLPLEGFERFARSYDDVFALQPEQLQLGFLKVLRGSVLYHNRGRYGLVYSEYAPYEVLCTPDISYAELADIKLVEEMTEVYYNSGHFRNQLRLLQEKWDSAFAMFLALGKTMPARNVGKYEYYDLLFRFAAKSGCDPDRFSWVMRFDLALHERLRKLPAYCAGGMDAGYRQQLAARKLPKQLYLDVFPFDPRTDENSGICAFAFNYENRDFMGNAEIAVLDFPAI